MKQHIQLADGTSLIVSGMKITADAEFKLFLRASDGNGHAITIFPTSEGPIKIETYGEGVEI